MPFYPAKSVMQAVVPPDDEVVVAGAASVLGKIGTVPAAATLFVRCPCAPLAPATSAIDWRVSCNKAATLAFYKARSVVNSITLTLAAVANTETIIINGLTFTGHTDTTTLATRTFSIAGSDTLDAVELAKCINDPVYGVPGVTATPAAAVVTLTATTATVIQAVTGTAGAHCVVASATLLSLVKDNAAPNGTLTDNSTTAGTLYQQYADGWPQCYLGITNNDGAAAATVVVGASLHGAL